MASINRGDNTGAFGNDFLRIYLNNPNNLYIQRAVFQINDDITKEFFDPIFPLRINFTGAETNMLRQVNVCKLALWDEYGRRRTADGKFTFFVKENRITEPDAPEISNEEYFEEDNSVYFSLEDAEFAAEFVINATPKKMSELEQDIYLMTPDKIIGGINVSTEVDADGYVTINADLDQVSDYNNLINKPKINGQELVGDIEIDLEPQVQADWKIGNPNSKAYIKNKPNLADVAISGNYNELHSKPFIPSKTSDLTNDSGFIGDEKLADYYDKEAVDALLETVVDLTPVYERIEGVEEDLSNKYTELNNGKADQIYLDNVVDRLSGTDTSLRNSINVNATAIDTINSSLDTFATKNEIEGFATNEELNNAVIGLASLDEMNTALSKKANKTSIGNGTLSISANNELIGEFKANASSNTDINLSIPTKTSQLENDIEFVTAEEISLDNLVTQAQLSEGLGTKVNITELGTGILSIQKNGELVGAFNANSDEDKTVNLLVPEKTSELDNDAGFLQLDDLDYIDSAIQTLTDNVDIQNTKINNFTTELDNKVDRKTGYSLMANSEINRLKTVDNYDDTEIRGIVAEAVEKVDSFDADISGKVDKIDGKGLSTNDYTNLDKDTLSSVNTSVTTLNTTVNTLNNKTTSLTNTVTAMATEVSDISATLIHETEARQNADNNLQTQIDALEAKSTVVDILGTLEDLDVYDTSKLNENDVICILCDETQNDSVTYYRWTGTTFRYIGSEGSTYKKAEANEKFALRTTEINGHSLTSNIELSASDVGAMDANTVIGNGIITIQVSSQSVSNIENIKQIETFELNQVGNQAVAIPIPTKTSQLKNDLEFVELSVLTQSYLGEPREDEYGDGGNTLLWDKCYYLEDLISTNSEHIAALEGNLPVVALTGNYYDLKNLPANISTNYKTIAKDQTYTDYIDETFIEELTEKGGFITDAVLEDNYALKSDIPTQVSQLENDRGFVTNNAIGRADLTLYLADEVLGSFNANSKEDIPITIPVDTALSTTSIKPVQNKLVTNELNLKAYDNQVVHLAGTENVTGTKTINSLFTSTQNITDRSTKAATTKFVDDYYTDKNQYLVHLADTETITGSKTFTSPVTFTNNVALSAATCATPSESSTGNQVVNASWVLSQEYALDSQVVHDGGNETINGNKTFAETVTFQGITNLGSYAHVNTVGTVNDCPVNVSYLSTNYYTKSQVDSLLQAKDQQIRELQQALNALTARVTALED